MKHKLKLYIIFFIIILVCVLFIPRKCKQEYFSNSNNTIYGIPKYIYQTCENINTLPEQFKNNINYIKRMNQDWEHVLYDDNMIIDFIQQNYGTKMLNIYKKINPNYGPARADLFRYLLMYKKGGVYLDIKSAMSKPLNEIIKEETFYVSHWKERYKSDIFPDKGEFQNWWIITPPNHPILKHVINKVISEINKCNHKTGKPGVLHTTGPIIYTKAILEILNKYNHKIYDTNQELGLIYNNSSKTKDQTSHQKLFKKHYSQLTEPVIICND